MELYSDIILTHNSTPFYFEKKTDAQYILEAYNPLCGDKFKIYLDIENDMISQIYFHGYGCAVSKAATSVLMKKIFGKNISDAKIILKNYFFILEKDLEKDLSKNNFEEKFFEEKNLEKNNFLDAEIFAFNAIKKFPERKTCATLSWEVVNDFLNQNFQNFQN